MNVIGQTVELRSDPAELALMRSFVTRWAERCGLSSAETFRACLVATEAVTNAMRHGQAASDQLERPIRVMCRADADGLVIEVGDRGTFRTALPSADDRGGRGLFLIRELSRTFDLRAGESGTSLSMRVGGNGAGSERREAVSVA